MSNGDELNDVFKQIDAAVSRLKEDLADKARRAGGVARLYGDLHHTLTLQGGAVTLNKFGFTHVMKTA